jgi:flagellin-like protein
MKGISAVIATILLLLIVVAIVGFTFGFFQNMFQTSADTTQTQVQSTAAAASVSLRAENLFPGTAGTQSPTVTIRNSGSSNLDTTTLSVYRKVGAGSYTLITRDTTGAGEPTLADRARWAADTVASGGSTTVRVSSTLPAVVCATGTKYKIVAASGLSSEVTC